MSQKGLTANADGLYLLSDLDTHMANAMAEYEAIEDAPTIIGNIATPGQRSAQRSYRLDGTQTTDATHGIIIKNNKKRIKE